MLLAHQLIRKLIYAVKYTWHFICRSIVEVKEGKIEVDVVEVDLVYAVEEVVQYRYHGLYKCLLLHLQFIPILL